ncbi:MAG TPA: hypothetical protein VFW07_06025, partial [Parafilimonas sp.]|nr:hypothetical protein [Parafilimonas sp.]
ALSKNFSAGVTVSYIFGSVQTNTIYSSDAIGLNIIRNEHNALNTPLFTGGLQYAGKISKHISQQIGVIVTAPAILKGAYSAEYVTNDSTITTESKAADPVALPLQVGVGYALVINNFTVSADYNFYNWKKQKVNYPNSYIYQAERFSTGIEYSFKRRVGLQMKEKYYLQAGFAYETGYIRIQNKPLNDYTWTVGAGNNVSRVLSYNLGLEFGRKGAGKYNQIRENYTQFVIGISFKDFWYNAAKYGRYQ